MPIQQLFEHLAGVWYVASEESRNVFQTTSEEGKVFTHRIRFEPEHGMTYLVKVLPGDKTRTDIGYVLPLHLRQAVNLGAYNVPVQPVR